MYFNKPDNSLNVRGSISLLTSLTPSLPIIRSPTIYVPLCVLNIYLINCHQIINYIHILSQFIF